MRYAGPPSTTQRGGEHLACPSTRSFFRRVSQEMADFVAKVGAEIGAGVDDHPFLPLAPMGAAASTHWH